METSVGRSIAVVTENYEFGYRTKQKDQTFLKRSDCRDYDGRVTNVSFFSE